MDQIPGVILIWITLILILMVNRLNIIHTCKYPLRWIKILYIYMLYDKRKVANDILKLLKSPKYQINRQIF